MISPSPNGTIRIAGARKGALILAAALCLSALAVRAQDGVQALCVASFPEDACTCATAALAEEIDAADYELYDAIGLAFRDEYAAGAEYVAAWDAAAATVMQEMGAGGSLTGRTNAIGRAHRDAVRACGG
jgi:hypothetical protein